ncbi:MAG: hypothetical protein C4516_02575 [Oxalobacter sp.]|nr:MAG: hypothetical protein C4516_02575 [Oxalobacter sp.]
MTRHFFIIERHKRFQNGSVLITGLIFLMILTMIALSSLSGGTMEEKLAANDRDRQVALQAAEAILREAETSLFSAPPFDPFDPDKFTDACQPADGEKLGGLCTELPLATAPRWRTVSWASRKNTRTFASKGGKLRDKFGELTAQPQYIVEIVSAPYKPNAAVARCEPGIAHITARGEGRNQSIVILQSTYRFLPKECL